MRIKLRRIRNQGSIVFLGVLIILGLAIGGCVVIKTISEARKIKQKLDQVATNAPPDEIVQLTLGQHQEQIVNADPPQPQPYQVHPAYNSNTKTNAWEDEYDESGF